MEIRPVLTFTFLMLATSLSAQTRMIAHKSHSGSAATFSLAMEESMFEPNGNFGNTPAMDELMRTRELDSVIYESDSKVILVISQERFQWNDSLGRSFIIPFRERQEVHLPAKTKTIKQIKALLKENHEFRNQVDSATYSGFDKREKKIKKNDSPFPVPFVHDDHQDPPANHSVYWMICIVVVLSFATGAVAYGYHGFRQSVGG